MSFYIQGYLDLVWDVIMDYLGLFHDNESMSKHFWFNQMLPAIKNAAGISENFATALTFCDRSGFCDRANMAAAAGP